jgi:hypothetical protein
MSARQEIAAAMSDGDRAAREGEPRTACPYRRGTGDRMEELLATLWCRAYDRVSPMPVDYGDEGSGS